MELLEDTFETATIRFTRQEVALLMGLLIAVGVDYNVLDKEIVNHTREEVEAFEEAFFDLFPEPAS